MTKKYNEIEAKDNMKIDNSEEDLPLGPEKKDKKLDKVVSAKPKKRKKSLVGRLAAGVLGPDGVSGVGEYVSNEIVIPAVRNIIYNAIESTARMTIFGDKNAGPGPNTHQYNRHRTTINHNNRTNYTSRYTSSNPEPTTERRAQPRRGVQGVEEYEIAERYDASHVLTSLTEHADMYGTVSIADYYDLIGVNSQYTDENYGWTFEVITQATIVPVRGGYVIKFPPAEVI